MCSCIINTVNIPSLRSWMKEYGGLAVENGVEATALPAWGNQSNQSVMSMLITLWNGWRTVWKYSWLTLISSDVEWNSPAHSHSDIFFWRSNYRETYLFKKKTEHGEKRKKEKCRTHRQSSCLSSSPAPGWCCARCRWRTCCCWVCPPKWLWRTWCSCPSLSCLGSLILLACTQIQSHAVRHKKVKNGGGAGAGGAYQRVGAC